jgi:hypothetical protein
MKEDKTPPKPQKPQPNFNYLDELIEKEYPQTEEEEN